MIGHASFYGGFHGSEPRLFPTLRGGWPGERPHKSLTGRFLFGPQESSWK
jgi:hypothetical protein